jgi:hypothetical protein
MARPGLMASQQKKSHHDNPSLLSAANAGWKRWAGERPCRRKRLQTPDLSEEDRQENVHCDYLLPASGIPNAYQSVENHGAAP